MILKYMLDEGGFCPKYFYPNDAGMDLFIPINLLLYPQDRVTVDLKIRFFIDPGYYLAIVPKSGLASKYGITITNSPGTVDSGYLNTVKVILQNTGFDVVEFKRGDKVCQGILKKKEPVELQRVYEIPIETDRNLGGFGSTGR